MIKSIEALKKDSEPCHCEKHLALVNAFYSDGRKIFICHVCNRTFVIDNIEDDDGMRQIEEVKRTAGDKKWVLTGYVRKCTLFN